MEDIKSISREALETRLAGLKEEKAKAESLLQAANNTINQVQPRLFAISGAIEVLEQVLRDQDYRPTPSPSENGRGK